MLTWVIPDRSKKTNPTAAVLIARRRNISFSCTYVYILFQRFYLCTFTYADCLPLLPFVNKRIFQPLHLSVAAP